MFEAEDMNQLLPRVSRITEQVFERNLQQLLCLGQNSGMVLLWWLD